MFQDSVSDMFDGNFSPDHHARKYVLITGFPSTASTADVERFISCQIDPGVNTKMVTYDDWTGEAVIEVESPHGQWFNSFIKC